MTDGTIDATTAAAEPAQTSSVGLQLTVLTALA